MLTVPSVPVYIRSSQTPSATWHPLIRMRSGPFQTWNVMNSPGPNSYVVTRPGGTGALHGPTRAGCARADSGNSVTSATAITASPARRVFIAALHVAAQGVVRPDRVSSGPAAPLRGCARAVLGMRPYRHGPRG